MSEYDGMPESEVRERIIEKVDSMPQKPRSLIRRPSDRYRENHERIFGRHDEEE